jgi:hypothetical protein
MENLLELPNELIEKCIRFCSLKDILNLFSVCSKLNEFKHLLNEAEKEYDIDKLKDNPFLIPIIKKITNVKSWYALFDYPVVESVSFRIGTIQDFDPEFKFKIGMSNIKQIIYPMHSNEKLVYDLIECNHINHLKTETWTKTHFIGDTVKFSEPIECAKFSWLRSEPTANEIVRSPFGLGLYQPIQIISQEQLLLNLEKILVSRAVVSDKIFEPDTKFITQQSNNFIKMFKKPIIINKRKKKSNKQIIIHDAKI